MKRILLIAVGFSCVAMSHAGRLSWVVVSKTPHVTTTGSGSWTNMGFGPTTYQAVASSDVNKSKPLGAPTGGDSSTANGYEVLDIRLYWDEAYQGDLAPDINLEYLITGLAEGMAAITGSPGGFTTVSTESKITLATGDEGIIITLAPQAPQSASASNSMLVDRVIEFSPSWGIVKNLGGGRRRCYTDVTVTMPNIKAVSSIYMSGFPALSGSASAFTTLNVDFKFTPA
jgi:hypothetical protein